VAAATRRRRRAGDAFAAAALARFEIGLPASDLPDVLRFGNAAGALATTETGAFTSLPDRTPVRVLAATSTT
jgi:fructokinase